MTDAAPPQPPGRGKTIALTVLLTTLFWTVAWGGFTVLRGRPQPVAFAVQPPPATATPAPTFTPTPAPIVEASPTAAAQATDTPIAVRAGAAVIDVAIDDPRAGDLLPAAGAAASPTVPANAAASLININTATAAELETLPSIGPKTAEAIIAYRDENGPFATVEAITEVKGIGPATLEKLRDLITVD